MAKINIYTIVKPSKDEFDKLSNEFIKMCSKFAKVEVHTIFNKNIAKAQTISEVEAQKSYSEAFEPYLKGFCIALDVLGDKVDSFEFSKLITSSSEINFFIGGAYGFEREFLKKCDKTLTLSSLTMAHKIVILVLLEQIFRGLAIKNNHPYHK
ncbi:23S rRNA (pseudouridine(1915)-N(3))-methyltransferase RlmH [Halarcobacter ebronensis]|uniref:Ribosomal RNA large subunit methyltransferase H n=1 Tax=Halarcobacter ebronensis TaxID=1462615 RepID=A0A4Q1ARE9_9BACT|nr:23S rRNA (pseudouridine(1915)-N(3))-methyltransferase RlmH [Halarcobacter ebronensis]QKF81150.1 SPOUT methyltransferase [Halarcobacter ebronensis]RXK03275.1 23S rRNA (pseudouridine(1915)-N(3))-methyltransferase RlmH [Halarcobacter ebronensis]